MSKVVVIGGGAAGMFASIAAAGCGHQVVVYEKNEKLGKKLYQIFFQAVVVFIHNQGMR